MDQVSQASLTAREIWQLLDANAIQRAVALCQQLNRDYPQFAEGWHVASHAAERAKLPGKALEFVDRALALEPENSGYLMQKATILRRVGRLEEGLAIARRLVGVRQNSAGGYNLLGSTLSQFDLHEGALDAFDAAIKLAADRDHYHFNRAAELRFLGRLAESEAACDSCIALNPQHFEAYLMRSDLRRQKPDNNHVEALRTLIPKVGKDWRGKAQLHFALAKELEDLEQYDESFQARAAGASLRRRHMVYKPDNDLNTIRAVRHTFSKTTYASIDSDFDVDSPVFIIGLPRTGTTLLERILDGHSQVHSAGELNTFAQELVRIVKQDFPHATGREAFVENSARIDFGALGQAYIESTLPVTGGKSRFIDKLPLNYLYAGLIHLALPRARIVHMRRHPMAACYAVYKQLFRDAYPFSYSLEELGNYYVAYHQLMQHWRHLIPKTAMTEVHYEDLVVNTEAEARRVLEFCGLPWQSQCLEFHNRESASTTASAAQVREPAHTRSVDQWRNYARQLAPLQHILEKGGVDGLD